MTGKNRIARSRKYFVKQVTKTAGCISLAILALNLVVPSRKFSANENRSLAQRPKLSRTALSDGTFFRDFDSYYSDQFVGRDLWMSIKSVEEYLIGVRESSGVLMGKKGYLMEKPVTPDEESQARKIEAINAFAGRHEDISFRMLLVPDAAAVLPNRLPGHAPVRDQIEDIKHFTMQTDARVTILNAAAALEKYSSESLYYKTDHHWTSNAAYHVFTENAAKMGIENPVMSYDRYTLSDSFRGTLASRSGRRFSKDKIEVFIPRGEGTRYLVHYRDSDQKSPSMFQTEKLKEKDQYQVFFGGNHPLVEIQTTANTGKNLMIFKDSYANSFVQFLYPYYDRIIMVDPRYYYDNIELDMTSYKITDVLYLYSADTFLTDKNLTDTLNSGGQEAEGEPAGESPASSESVSQSLSSSSQSSGTGPETVSSSSADGGDGGF